MNLRNFVEGLTIAEREELIDILTENYTTWTTMPPHIKEMLSQDEKRDKTSVMENFQVIKDNNVNKKRKEAVKAHGNTWEDTGEDRHIETPKVNITPRNRSKPKIKEIKCHVCGKTQKVNASLVYGEYYRCDNCVGR